MPKINVIIPVYNAEKYLERCIQSLINQTLSDIEILFIDDCSTDNSLEILKKYEKIDSRIKVYTLDKNSGAAVARNKGLENAKGEYLNFVDSDDAIELNFYEKLYNKAIETDVQIVKCSRRTFETDGRTTYSNLNNIIKEKGNLFFGYEWQTAIYKTSLIKENNIKFTPELIKAQDIAFLNKVLLKTTKPIEFVEDVYYNYYRRSDSLNANKIPLKYINSAVLSQKIQCQDFNNSELFEKNPCLYNELYILRPMVLISLTAFQNPEYDCAQGIIDCYTVCKDKSAFLYLFPYK